MLRIAIIGCGNIADSHASQIARVAGCELVAACDREGLMAKQLCDRFSIGGEYSDVGEMLRQEDPDVVHITTPPQSHHSLATQCLEHGCHVYLEKPFTVHAWEAEELVDLARRKGLSLIAGHDAQFSPASMRLRELIKGGYLGGAPVHLECTWCYSLADPSYAKAFLGNDQHWLRKLPGALLQNIISHGVGLIGEYFDCDNPTIIAHGYVSPVLRELGENELIDELRVILSDGKSRTAYFTFSSQMQPSLHTFEIYGEKNGVVLDEGRQTVTKLSGKKYKSYVERFAPAADLVRQGIGNLFRNAGLLLTNRFHMEASKKNLIEEFYASIRDGSPPPISPREILFTARVMEAIFKQVCRAPGEESAPAPQAVANSR